MKNYLVVIFFNLMILCLIANTSCTLQQIQAIEDAAVNPPKSAVPLAKATTIAQAEALPPLSWKNDAWTRSAVASVKLELTNLSKAKDMPKFCPTWAKLKEADKVHALSTLVATMVKYESHYNPKEIYHEASGLDSLGLLQLSTPDARYGGDCRGLTRSTLFEPITNLKCGIHILGALVSQDHVIQDANDSGGARYWSVLRDGHHIVEIKHAVQALDICKGN